VTAALTHVWNARCFTTHRSEKTTNCVEKGMTMRRRYEPERRHPRERGWSEGREHEDRDGYGEYPGQFGGDYVDAERRSGSRNAYAEGERDTGGWGNRTEGGRDYARERGAPSYAGQGRLPEHGYGAYRAPEYGMGAPGRSRDHRQPSRDRWEATEYPGVPGGPGQESLSRGFRGRGPRGYSRSDERIREEICERLMDEDIDVSEVEVSVTKGEVTLSGSVSDRWTKREAENIAEQVTGVKDVSNQIRVRSETERHASSSGAGSSSPNSTGQNDKRAH
jgi:hypothetical protein